MSVDYQQVAVVFRNDRRVPLLECPHCAALVLNADEHSRWHAQRLVVLREAGTGPGVALPAD